MGGRATTTVDVRDMLCAQALAVVAQALAPLKPGAWLVIRYNAQDVKRDLLAWAIDQRHPIEEDGPTTLRIRRQHR